VTTIAPFSELLTAIEATQDTDPVESDMKKKIGYPELSKTGGEDGLQDNNMEMLWKVIGGGLPLVGFIYVAKALHMQVISLLQDNPETGQFGALKSAEIVSTDHNWLE